MKHSTPLWMIFIGVAPVSPVTTRLPARTPGTATTPTEIVLRKNKKQPKPATEYNWDTIYAVVKATSDRVVREALAKFGVKP